MDDENLARMFGSSTSIVEQNLRSVACVPLRDEDDMFGVLYIDSRSRALLVFLNDFFANSIFRQIRDGEKFELLHEFAAVGVHGFR